MLSTSKVSTHLLYVVLFGAFMSGALVWAHGGKGHGSGGEFTNLEALKKATQVYDKLVGSEKFGIDWETGLESIKITEREKQGGTEKVVAFYRSAEKDPQVVYIFFKSNGEYAGSNFTGR